VRLGSANILLTELLDLLTEDQREMLLQAAVCVAPMTVDDLTHALHSDSAGEQQQRDTPASVDRLLALTLLSLSGQHEIVVHPWVGQALHPHHGDQLLERHRRAARMRMRRINSPRRTFDDFTEVARHFTAVEDFDSLAQFAQSATRPGVLGQLALAALLADIVAGLPTTHPVYLAIADAEANALLACGNTNAAVERLRAIHEKVLQHAAANPANAQNQRNLSVSYERLGGVISVVGNLVEAERFFRDSLAIAERLAAADPTNAQNQRDLTVSYIKLGDVISAVGNLAEAERFFRDSLAIRERLAAADPTNAQNQRDLSAVHQRTEDLTPASNESPLTA
jgi:hypothetical protein